MITLHGTISREIDARICFQVAPDQADAPAYGLTGEIWLTRRQCRDVIEAKSRGQLDVITIDESVAMGKGLVPTKQKVAR